MLSFVREINQMNECMLNKSSKKNEFASQTNIAETLELAQEQFDIICYNECAKVEQHLMNSPSN